MVDPSVVRIESRDRLQSGQNSFDSVRISGVRQGRKNCELWCSACLLPDRHPWNVGR